LPDKSTDAALVRSQLERILASPEFEAAPRSARFLRYVVEAALEGKGDELKEYLVAVEAFDRPVSFDPARDSTIRGEAMKLRQRLSSYYSNGGKADSLLISLPKGRYVPAFRRSRPATGRAWRVALGAAALAAAMGAGIWVRSAARPQARYTLAVFPVKNTGGPDAEPVCIGLTEEITAGLGRIQELRVLAPFTSAQLSRTIEGRDARMKEAGLDAYLEGTLRQDERRFRITLRLVDAAQGVQVWSETYEREGRPAMAAEGEIARAVTASLAHRLGRTGSPTVVEGQFAPEALDLYWRARDLRIRRAPGSFPQSAALYERATLVDPRFGPAFAALADTYALMGFHQLMPAGDAAEKAERAAARALALDPGLVEAIVGQALATGFLRHRWQESQALFAQALRVNPSFAKGQQMFALTLTAMGNTAEAVAHARLARSLDPLSYSMSNDLSVILYCARQFREAEATSRRVLDADPQFWVAHLAVGMGLRGQGRCVEAVGEFRAATAVSRDATVLGRLGDALACAGQQQDAGTIAHELRTVTTDGPVNVGIAMVLAGLGEAEGALDALETAERKHETDLHFLKVETIFDRLRPLPRFRAIEQRLGLAGK
jgi:TolB-like protein